VWRGVFYGNLPNATQTVNEITFYAPGGAKLAMYRLPLAGYSTSSSFYEYFGGKMIRNAQGWVTPDRLGSIGKYFPYGQERPSATAEGTEKFATYFRDENTGLDYAQNRYHKPGEGRFMTVDPLDARATPSDPGTWNRYLYVGGDPVNFNDPTGEFIGIPDGGGLPFPVIGGVIGPLGGVGASNIPGGFGSSAEYFRVLHGLGQLQKEGLISGWSLSGTTFSLTGAEELAAVCFFNPVQCTSVIVMGGGAVYYSITVFAQQMASLIDSLAAFGSKFPTLDEIRTQCIPVGPPVEVPSTNTRNPGGTSREQEYLCPDGKTYTIHTLVDRLGNIIEEHARPGAPKYGRGLGFPKRR
jgi:RHS repeat-associated protein